MSLIGRGRGKGSGKGSYQGRGGKGYGVSLTELGLISSAILHMRIQDLEQIESLCLTRRMMLESTVAKGPEPAPDDEPRKGTPEGTPKDVKKKKQKPENSRFWNRQYVRDVKFFQLAAEDESIQTEKIFSGACCKVGAYLVRAKDAGIKEEAIMLDLHFGCRIVNNGKLPSSEGLAYLDMLYRVKYVSTDVADKVTNEAINQSVNDIEALDAFQQSVVDGMVEKNSENAKSIFVVPSINAHGKRKRGEECDDETYLTYIKKRNIAHMIEAKEILADEISI